MGDIISVTSADGFSFSAYQAMPAGTPKGGVMVIQEIFGVNQHIREVVDGYAAQGYVALAPAIFDRIKTGVELGYDESGMADGMSYAFEQLDHAKTLQDLAAAVAILKQYGKVGSVGYCFGGLLSFLSAGNIDALDCAVAYYGGGIADNLASVPKAPIMFHFGDRDDFIPMDQVAAVKQALPDAPAFVYEADHGFNCDHRATHDQAAADLALERTLSFFAEHIG
ncbi:MAG: dienelactone hydrolase family protein [Parvibaculales bacterium]